MVTGRYGSKHVEPSVNFGIINSITSCILLIFLLSHGVASNFENTIYVLYAARRVAFLQKSIHMGSDHTNLPSLLQLKLQLVLYSLHFKE
jgi:hypothetical protein